MLNVYIFILIILFKISSGSKTTNSMKDTPNFHNFQLNQKSRIMIGKNHVNQGAMMIF